MKNKNSSWAFKIKLLAINVAVLTLLSGCSKDDKTQEENDSNCGCEKSNITIGKVSFMSDQTWTVGNQIWSAPVVISYCNKDDYYGGEKNDYGKYKSDGRKNIRSDYSQLFSWCLVNQYASQIARDGWRIPTKKDFETLFYTLGCVDGEKTLEEFQADVYRINTAWSPFYSGAIWWNAEPEYQGDFDVCWSITESEKNSAYVLRISNGKGFGVLGIDKSGDWYKANAASLRLVKNK